MVLKSDIARGALQTSLSFVTAALSSFMVQRATVLHSFEPVPQAQRAAIRFCPDDPWRLTVKNLSFISVQGLKVAYVYNALTEAKIETDRDWTLYPNGPSERQDSPIGRYYSWNLGNLLAGETVSIVFCFPKGLAAQNIRVAPSGRDRMLVRTDNANSTEVTGGNVAALLEAPVVLIFLGWLAAIGGVIYLFIKLFAFVMELMQRRRRADAEAFIGKT